jgi:hypothetical protein
MLQSYGNCLRLPRLFQRVALVHAAEQVAVAAAVVAGAKCFSLHEPFYIEPGPLLTRMHIDNAGQ